MWLINTETPDDTETLGGSCVTSVHSPVCNTHPWGYDTTIRTVATHEPPSVAMSAANRFPR
jgi:hypothetical protein